jgi:hypothetical protein
MSFRAIGWVASHEHIILPFSTPELHSLSSADSKATQAANNKERLGVRHDIVWCRTILVARLLTSTEIMNYKIWICEVSS